MAVFAIEISDTPTRMLSKGEAARYCRIPIARFPVICPVSPLDMGQGIKAYDVRDLDAWIDSLKGGENQANEDALIARL